MADFQDLYKQVLGQISPPTAPPAPPDPVAKFFLSAAAGIEYIGITVLFVGIAISLFGMIKMLIEKKSLDSVEINAIALRFAFFGFIGVGILLVWQVVLMIFNPTFTDALTMSELLGIIMIVGYFLRRGTKGDKLTA